MAAKSAAPRASKWVDVFTIADIYGVSYGTIYRMAKEGQLPHIKVRATYRFNVEEVAKALEGQTITESKPEEVAA